MAWLPPWERLKLPDGKRTPALFPSGNPISSSEEAVRRGAASLICPSAGALYVTDTNTCWGDRISPGPGWLVSRIEPY